MHKVGLYAFITMMLFVAACMMLTAGSHPGMIVLVLGGMALLAFRVNTIIDRAYAPRQAPGLHHEFHGYQRTQGQRLD